SFSMGSFLVYLALNLFYFFILISLSIMMFVLGYISNIQWLFMVFVVVIIPLFFWLLRVVFLKKRLALNIDFNHFLLRLEKNEHEVDNGNLDKLEFPGDLKKLFKEIKSSLKKNGIKCIPTKLVTVLAAAHIGEHGKTKDLEEKEQLSYGEHCQRWQRDAIRLSLLEALAFIILFIPFGLISFLFTLGMSSSIMQLIYAMGFLFAWFLHAGIITPIVGLIMQGKIKPPGKTEK
ncbi:MAG: hypothetical protein MUF15_09425, partial [Acidobacteria bacterium]|nr:hypothetical protein [Acidobacteriota bacterium]